ncbi:hypothetical protein BaRGS_00014447, partial [Batillaria attramentaria]
RQPSLCLSSRGPLRHVREQKEGRQFLEQSPLIKGSVGGCVAVWSVRVGRWSLNQTRLRRESEFVNYPRNGVQPGTGTRSKAA